MTRNGWRQLSRGMDRLRERALAGIVGHNRAMLEPLLELIRNTEPGNDERRAMQELHDKLPDLLDQFDDEAITDWAAALLMQTYAVSWTASVPPGLESETIEETT